MSMNASLFLQYFHDIVCQKLQRCVWICQNYVQAIVGLVHKLLNKMWTKWWWVYRSDCSALCRRTRSISHRRSSYTSTYQPLRSAVHICLPMSFDIWNFTTLYYYLSVALLCTDVQSNADVALVDNKGLSVLHYACLGQHMSCVQLLLNKEASVLLKDEVILCATLLVGSTLMVIDHYRNLHKSSS